MGTSEIRPPCDHHESLWGRCAACGMTWEQQAKRPATVSSTLSEEAWKARQNGGSDVQADAS